MFTTEIQEIAEIAENRITIKENGDLQLDNARVPLINPDETSQINAEKSAIVDIIMMQNTSLTEKGINKEDVETVVTNRVNFLLGEAE